MSYERMSACGLDCKTCGILLFPESPKAQEGILAWFRREKWIGENDGVKEVIEKKMYCKGCGDKEVFWSKNCAIAKCCTDTKNLTNCSECSDFPCDTYNKWLNSSHPSQAPKYKEAFEYLQQIKVKD